MKIYIQVDMEGAAGVVFFEDRKTDTHDNFNRRQRMRKLITGEVNAAIEGAFEGGATTVTVWDSHGEGYNIIFEELHPDAEIINGDYHRAPWLPFFDEGYDAGFYIGAHAMAGTPFATLPHSRKVLNRKVYGELGMFIAICGSRDVPVLLATGDQAAMKEARDLVPNIETVITKKALCPFLAKSISPKKAQELIREASKRAIKRFKEIKPYKINPPYEFKIEKEGKEVSYKGTDLLETYTKYLNIYGGHQAGLQTVDIPEYDKYLEARYKRKIE